MGLKCLLGMHTDNHDSRYQFKAYNNVEYPLIVKGTTLDGHGSISAYYHKTCGDCGKDLGEQVFSMGWYPEGTYRNLPHSMEECIKRARAFQSNR